MSKLKVGDKVKRVWEGNEHCPQGTIGYITKLEYGYCSINSIIVGDGTVPFDVQAFILIEEEDMKPNVIDIRKQTTPVIVDTIVVAEMAGGNFKDIQKINKHHHTGFIRLIGETENQILYVNNKQDCENLILGLQKALELGWL